MARIQLDAKAPPTEGVDMNGRKVSLADLFQEGPVVLVFNRGFL